MESHIEDRRLVSIDDKKVIKIEPNEHAQDNESDTHEKISHLAIKIEIKVLFQVFRQDGKIFS